MRAPCNTCLGSSCTDGDGIINCFKLKPPPIRGADLSPVEVRCIIESVRMHNFQLITESLLSLKIFKTVSRGFMSMEGSPSVFVMPHNMPSDGIEIESPYYGPNYHL
jgi:hypothetical protein